MILSRGDVFLVRMLLMLLAFVPYREAAPMPDAGSMMMPPAAPLGSVTKQPPTTFLDIP